MPDDRQSERMLLSMMALWPIVPVLMIANLFACRSLAEGSQRATLLEAMPALLMILTVILWPSRSIVPVMIGLITGAALQMALLARSMPRGSRWHWRNSPFKGELWLTISPFLIWLTVIYGLMAVAGAIDTLFAAALPTGSIATLSYATRLVSLALTLIGMAGSRALLPVLSSVAVQKPHMLSSIVTVWAAIAFVVGCIGVAVTWWLGRPAIVLLFERGAFNADDTEQVTAVLKLLMMQLPFAAVVMVLMQPLLAERRFSALVGLAVVSLMAKLVSAPLLIDYAGLQGLAFSNAVTGACQLVYLVCIYGVRRMPPIQSS